MCDVKPRLLSLASEVVVCEHVGPRDLPAFLPYACALMQAPFVLRLAITQDVDKSGELSRRSKSRAVHKSRTSVIKDPSFSALTGGSGSGVPASDGPVVRVELVLDRGGRACALRLLTPPPRLLMKVLQLALPYHPALERLDARRVPLDGVLLHEIGNALRLCNLTDLCLDDCYAACVDELGALAAGGRVRRLSLARCGLADDGCCALAAALSCASCAVAVLTLCTNAVTDAGCSALGHALRSNRSVRHLDLAGNRVTDAGAGALLRVLGPFPLTADELLTQRRGLLAHLKRRNAVADHYRRQLEAEQAQRALEAARRTTKPTRGKKGAATEKTPARGAQESPETIQAQALLMADELLGPPGGPWGVDDTFLRGDLPYCKGNRALCSLNLAYNDLRHPSVEMLLEVLAAQGEEGGAGGLLRVRLEGNPLPDMSHLDLLQIQDYLNRAAFGGDLKRDRKIRIK